MSEQEARRIEKHLSDLMKEVSGIRSELAGLNQWKADRGEICDKHDKAISVIRIGLEDERIDRTEAIGKVWSEMRGRLSMWAALSSFLGTLIPGLLLWWKLGPVLAKMASGG